jgi:programmed cell death protein 4
MSTEIERAVSENFQDGDAEGLNRNALFSRESAQNGPVKEGRVFKKAKRTVRSPRKSESDGDDASLSPTGLHLNGQAVAFSKNSRKSRTGFGRGLPKKGGAGGKGVWGKPGVVEESSGYMDANDPNYDSDSQEAIRLEKVIPALDEDQLHRALEPILHEYLEHGDSTEVKILLRDLNIDGQRHHIASTAVSLALDRHDPHRELTSRLISDLHGPVLSTTDLSAGFNALLDNLQDLTLDTPDAPTVLGQFIARAVADDCLTKDFISSYKGHVDSTLVQKALEKAEVLIQMGSIAQLDTVWGQGGGNRPVKYLTNKIVMLLREYMDSSDATEAMRCLRELDVPHFHHELVYQAALIAIEDSTDQAAEAMTTILKFFYNTNIITPEQLRKGVLRVFDDMPDICVDVPAAYALLERLGNKLYGAGVLNDDLMKEMPTRGRKRFVSEGDGGKIKEAQLH